MFTSREIKMWHDCPFSLQFVYHRCIRVPLGHIRSTSQCVLAETLEKVGKWVIWFKQQILLYPNQTLCICVILYNQRKPTWYLCYLASRVDRTKFIFVAFLFVFLFNTLELNLHIYISQWYSLILTQWWKIAVCKVFTLPKVTFGSHLAICQMIFQ